MTFAQRRNRLTKHFSESIPIVKRRMTVETKEHTVACTEGCTMYLTNTDYIRNRLCRPFLFRSFTHSFIHDVCLATCSQPAPKRVLQIVRSSASSFKFKDLLLSLTLRRLIFFLFKQCKFTIYSVCGAMSKCDICSQLEGRSHSVMTLRLHLGWGVTGRLSCHLGVEQVGHPLSLQSAGVGRWDGHRRDEVIMMAYQKYLNTGKVK